MDLLTQLRRDEGVRYEPYQDSLGYMTVGCGHKLLPTDQFVYPLTDGGVNEILVRDVADKIFHLGQYPWFNKLDECRQGALINMAFNLGVYGLLGFPHALSAIASGDWKTAHDQMLDSLWAKEVGPRATRLATQILTGVWQ